MRIRICKSYTVYVEFFFLSSERLTTMDRIVIFLLKEIQCLVKSEMCITCTSFSIFFLLNTRSVKSCAPNKLSELTYLILLKLYNSCVNCGRNIYHIPKNYFLTNAQKLWGEHLPYSLELHYFLQMHRDVKLG